MPKMTVSFELDETEVALLAADMKPGARAIKRLMADARFAEFLANDMKTQLMAEAADPKPHSGLADAIWEIYSEILG